jgi:hypothetical protein
MKSIPYVHDRHHLDAASALIQSHGTLATSEAKARANESRDRGNVIKFCKWRQVERLILSLEPGAAAASIH